MKADYVHKDSKTSTNETISYKITMPLIDDEELKKQLPSENRMRADGTQHIETRCPYCERVYGISLPVNIKYIETLKENQELKKQLDSKYNITMFVDNNETQEELDERMGNDMYQKYLEKENQKLKNHQKEFIEFLENCINKTDYEVNILGNYNYLAWSNAYKNILSKYKEIIGEKDEM